MAEKKSHDPERRRYPRVKAKVPAELICSGKSQMRTATDEISLCGCYIETMFTMDVGTKLGLVFSLNQDRVGANGIVATKHPQVGNGIDFTEMEPESRLKLGEYIAEREREAKTSRPKGAILLLCTFLNNHQLKPQLAKGFSACSLPKRIFVFPLDQGREGRQPPSRASEKVDSRKRNRRPLRRQHI